MTEFDLSPERRARLALDEYTLLDPSIMPGDVPVEQIRKWQEACEGLPLSPEDELHLAWMDVECASAIAVGGHDFDVDTAVEKTAGYLDAAAARFRAVANNESLQVTDLQRSQALIGHGGALIRKGLLPGTPFDQLHEAYLRAQADSAKLMLRHLAETGSARAAMHADSLVLIMALSADDFGYKPLPIPLRCMSADVDGALRWNALVMNREMVLRLVRVAEDGPPNMIVVPPSVFGPKGLAHNTGYAILDTFIQQQALLDRASTGTIKLGNEREKAQFTAQITKQLAKTAKITGAVARIVAEQDAAMLAPGTYVHAPQEPQDPREWYRTLEPLRQPGFVDKQKLDEAMTPLELQFAEETITADDAIELAWMHIEYAMGSTLDPHIGSSQIKGDLDRAEDIFDFALNAIDSERDTIRYYDAWLAREGLRLYRAMVAQDPDMQARLDEYFEALMLVGGRAATQYERIPDKKTAAAEELGTYIQILTACGLIVGQGYGGYIALPASPRQRKAGGWDVSVWSQTEEGFLPARYGRLRITEKEDHESLSDGIVTITPTMMAQRVRAKRTATLQAMVRQAAGQGGVHRPVIESAWRAIEKSVVAAEV